MTMTNEDQPREAPAIEGEASTLDIHEAIMRESADPDEGVDPGPRWFYALLVLALVTGGVYFSRHYGSLGPAPHLGFTEAFDTMRKDPRSAQQTISGAAIYAERCANCHQASGSGIPGAFPPLANSSYVLGDPTVPTWMVLHGLSGPLTVEGQDYDGIMPGWADKLSDGEIAAVINFIRNELGKNKAPPVNAAFVAGVRRQTLASAPLSGAQPHPSTGAPQ
jgi:mono/diheme cytochrome c family protein